MRDTMRDTLKHTATAESDPFGLRKLDLRTRVPEKSEMFTDEEARLYIHGCDFPESADDLLVALEINERWFSKSDIQNIQNMNILDSMTGPGRLGRELLQLGAGHVTFQDGHTVMLDHARNMASELFSEDRFSTILSPVDQIATPDNIFDLVVVHNSTHQLDSEEKLQKVISEFVRVTKPGGFVMIADYQRNSTPEFILAMETRLMWTKSEIVPLLIPTFQAAFTKNEFDDAVAQTKKVTQWLTFDASLPVVTPEMQNRINQDPVKGHVLDFSPISCRVIIQKERI